MKFFLYILKITICQGIGLAMYLILNHFLPNTLWIAVLLGLNFQHNLDYEHKKG